MIPEFYVYLGVGIVLMSLGRIVWRRSRTKVDWELIVAFVRLEFPAEQRDIAQKVAAGLAEIVGIKIKQLRPEDTLNQIANWAEERIHVRDLISVFNIAYGVNCEPQMTFRSLVGKIAEKQQQDANPAP
jgi:hypothetical protein